MSLSRGGTREHTGKPQQAARSIISLVPLLLAAAPSVAAQAAPPAARLEPVTDTYYDTTIVDTYRWMEAGGPELTAWLRAQDAHTRAVLDRIPGRETFRRRYEELDRPALRSLTLRSRRLDGSVQKGRTTAPSPGPPVMYVALASSRAVTAYRDRQLGSEPRPRPRPLTRSCGRATVQGHSGAGHGRRGGRWFTAAPSISPAPGTPPGSPWPPRRRRAG
jgi:hypothetical protein